MIEEKQTVRGDFFHIKLLLQPGEVFDSESNGRNFSSSAPPAFLKFCVGGWFFSSNINIKMKADLIWNFLFWTPMILCVVSYAVDFIWNRLTSSRRSIGEPLHPQAPKSLIFKGDSTASTLKIPHSEYTKEKLTVTNKNKLRNQASKRIESDRKKVFKFTQKSQRSRKFLLTSLDISDVIRATSTNVNPNLIIK